MSWFYASNKKKVGPVTWSDLQTAAAAGKLLPTDMVLSVGSTRWVQAQTVPGLFVQARLIVAEQPATPVSRKPAGGAARSRLLVLTWAAAMIVVLLLGVGWYWSQSQLPRDLAQHPDSEITKPQDDPKVPAHLFDRALRKINSQRRLSGLPAVVIDVKLSEGCQAHARYLLRNPQSVEEKKENPALPGFSAAGQQAAEHALAFDGEPVPVIDACLTRAAARTALLHPDLRGIGLGVAHDGAGKWRTVLDAEQGRRDLVILCPSPDQRDVPLHFAGGPEIPIPFNKQNAGFPITASFSPERGIAQVKATLSKGDQAVDCFLSTPAQPIDKRRQRNTICLIPKEPLEPGTKYTAALQAQNDGAPWTQTWTFTTADDLDTLGHWARTALARINDIRKQAGVEPVVLDKALTQGCRNHARYLVLNLEHPSLRGLGAHDEDPSLPGASEEGKKAGKGGNIALGDHDPLAALDGWLATLYHRIPLLDPRLRRIGFCCARGPRLGWYSVLDVASGRDPEPLTKAFAFPAPDQKDVPQSFPTGGEIPDPIPDDKDGRAGFPITLTMPQDQVPDKATGSLQDAAGTEVDVWFSSPQAPANPLYKTFQGPTICLIPKDPLQPRTTYKIMLRGELEGKPWQQSWSFTTGAEGADIAQESVAVLKRINRYRHEAGLPPVTLDPAISKGCQAHADYLVRHNHLRGTPDFNANEENPKLPGYTKAGDQAAGYSDVFLQAPAPAFQVDLMHAGFFRRVFLLDPNLRRVGYGCKMEVGRGWTCVLDMSTGRSLPPPILCPAPDQSDVPLAGLDRVPETADKQAGFPITVTFPSDVRIHQAKASLQDASGKTLDVFVATPEQPLEQQPANTLCILPHVPLLPDTTYRVTASAFVAGRSWEQSWQFTTRP